MAPPSTQNSQVRFKLASSYSGRVLKHVYEDGQELDSPEEKYPHSFVHHKMPPNHLEVEQLLGFEDGEQQGELNETLIPDLNYFSQTGSTVGVSDLCYQSPLDLDTVFCSVPRCLPPNRAHRPANQRVQRDGGLQAGCRPDSGDGRRERSEQQSRLLIFI